MPYILDNWIKDKNNLPEIYRVMDYLYQDILLPGMRAEKEKAIQHLKNIGEDIIYDKIINGHFSFGA